ncbi:MAG: hypothetical protein A2312_00295 [Candidatus Staskawiczbacteria bacterium RIFOXYB2_FULL_32_9]|uniref:Thioredoxin-like fold domain-containing protein n=1 Tax=Candidatus Staskawiczbacteria bacterium RIFOXYD1_FULL_32_13 TaxID=1802234 RepID=A0A1G2JJU7_9BACT|nr:MAG: hypothetical protein UR22_C0017G0012 [Parcubacteria group bacterium GW2011_GWC2_32_10]OGZ77684.1 MAG: hypothetical protein A2256_04380 [Candidatus Staskawiczbacteria bacterium RIFOXYA2_FULL_32_7]OGZ84862.1 MAG: hypothetical protein A2312_00295 [Candidatus Staskawiczbacteria bacterium RIFOXYB2_FULL_32_9]OGZ85443.1 MAG: hypothetical protein A2463_04340 [Candidatus Staskawiczbacteria bacterium RIFOXYC2_FULL_32_10]OGZ87407.1 MAG: hypothetical protein A2561_04990 [Candidatus Staskawiczbacter
MNILKKINKNTVVTLIAVVGVTFVGILISGKSSLNFSLSKLISPRISSQEIAQKSIDYLNNVVLKGQSTASLISVSEENEFVRIKIKVGSNEFDSYATKDGKLLFPQAFNLSEEKTDTVATNTASKSNDAEKQKAATSVEKSDNPVLEAYIVSRCPFGLQMQRAMSEAIKSMPELNKYMKVLYMGSVSNDGKSITAMHGEAEAKENLRQICIREEQAEKYWDYSACQMKSSGQEVACEKSIGIDSTKLNSCMSDPSRGVAYAKKDFEGQNKYNVTGSPTMVLGQAVISENGFGGRSADGIKSMICAGFNNQPSFCSTKLNTNPAATSFSVSTTTGAKAGNSGSGTNCAPAQ